MWTAVVCLAVGAAAGMLLRPPAGPPPLPPPPLYTPFSLPLAERHFAYELARMDVPTLVTKLRRLVSGAQGLRSSAFNRMGALLDLAAPAVVVACTVLD